jgi:hypothetical protein
MIERPRILLRLVMLKPPTAAHFVKELHPCHACEMVVAGAGLAHGGIAVDLACRLGAAGWCVRCRGPQCCQHGFDTCSVRVIDALASETRHRHETHLAQECEVHRGTGLWDTEACHDIADGCLPLKEEQEDAQTCDVCKSLSALREYLHCIYLF